MSALLPLPQAREALRPERLIKKGQVSEQDAPKLSEAWQAVAKALATLPEERLFSPQEAQARAAGLKSLEAALSQIAQVTFEQDYKGAAMNSAALSPKIRLAERCARGAGLGGEAIDELWELAFNQLMMSYAAHPRNEQALFKAAQEASDRHALSERLAWTLAEEAAGLALEGLSGPLNGQETLAVTGLLCAQALARFANVALGRDNPARPRAWMGERECRLCEGLLKVCEASATASLTQSPAERAQIAQAAAQGGELLAMVEASRAARRAPNVKSRKILEAGPEAPSRPAGPSMG